MKRFLAIILIFTLLSFSQEKNGCEEPTMPYWANGINSRIEGEGPTLRNAFRDLQLTETNIRPNDGFITLRLNISKNGKLCDIETFEIDQNYEDTKFNGGELIKKLQKIAVGLTNWKRDKDFKTYNLIRLKIKNGQIEEIF